MLMSLSENAVYFRELCEVNGVNVGIDGCVDPNHVIAEIGSQLSTDPLSFQPAEVLAAAEELVAIARSSIAKEKALLALAEMSHDQPRTVRARML